MPALLPSPMRCRGESLLFREGWIPPPCEDIEPGGEIQGAQALKALPSLDISRKEHCWHLQSRSPGTLLRGGIRAGLTRGQVWAAQCGVCIASCMGDAWLYCSPKYEGYVSCPKGCAGGGVGPKEKGPWTCQGTGSSCGLLWTSALPLGTSPHQDVSEEEC